MFASSAKESLEAQWCTRPTVSVLPFAQNSALLPAALKVFLPYTGIFLRPFGFCNERHKVLVSGGICLLVAKVPAKRT